MKIALIHHQYISRGGMERYLIDLVKGFSDAGDDVTLVTSKVDEKTPYYDRCKVVKNDVKIIPKPLRKIFFSGRLMSVMKKLKYDLSLSVTRSTGQKMIVCGGTHIGYLQHIMKKPSLMDQLEISHEKNCYDSTPVIIPHSEMMKKELGQLYGVSDDKMRVIYPPVDCDRFRPELKGEQLKFKEEFGLDKNRFVLLFVSTGHKRKGLDLVLDAFAALPQRDFQLAIAGSRPDESLPEHRVKYLGYVTDMPKLYAAADLTLLPSQYEPFGLAAVESVQCGTPVVLSPHVGAGELMDDAIALKMESLTAENLKANILKAFENKLDIDFNFAQKNRLTLQSHIKQIKICNSDFFGN